MTHNAAVQPRTRAQRECVGWNRLLGATLDENRMSFEAKLYIGLSFRDSFKLGRSASVCLGVREGLLPVFTGRRVAPKNAPVVRINLQLRPMLLCVCGARLALQDHLVHPLTPD
jgi:hypothetical protein